jgi:hypothetical protein
MQSLPPPSALPASTRPKSTTTSITGDEFLQIFSAHCNLELGISTSCSHPPSNLGQSTLLSHRLVHSLLNIRLGASRFTTRSRRSDLGLVILVIVIIIVSTLPLASLLVFTSVGSASSTDLAGRLSKTEAFGEVTKVEILDMEETFLLMRMGRIGSDIGGKGLSGEIGVLSRHSKGNNTIVSLRNFAGWIRR